MGAVKSERTYKSFGMSRQGRADMHWHVDLYRIFYIIRSLVIIKGLLRKGIYI